MYGVFYDNDALDDPACTRDVYAAEIQKVLPFLKPASFCSSFDSVKIYSKLVLNNTQRWFTMPVYPVDAKSLVGRAVGRYIEGMKRSEREESIDAVFSPARSIDDSVANLQLRIRSLRRRRNWIHALEKGTCKTLTEDDHALVATKISVFKELKECEDLLRELL